MVRACSLPAEDTTMKNRVAKKAHLGLAHLDEARNRCDEARKHALVAASIPDIEIKTVRRALELAARCTR